MSGRLSGLIVSRDPTVRAQGRSIAESLGVDVLRAWDAAQRFAPEWSRVDEQLQRLPENPPLGQLGFLVVREQEWGQLLAPLLAQLDQVEEQATREQP